MKDAYESQDPKAEVPKVDRDQKDPEKTIHVPAHWRRPPRRGAKATPPKRFRVRLHG